MAWVPPGSIHGPLLTYVAFQLFIYLMGQWGGWRTLGARELPKSV